MIDATTAIYTTARAPYVKTTNKKQTIATCVVLIITSALISLTVKKSRRREADRFIYNEIKAIVTSDTITNKEIECFALKKTQCCGLFDCFK